MGNSDPPLTLSPHAILAQEMHICFLLASLEALAVWDSALTSLWKEDFTFSGLEPLTWH